MAKKLSASSPREKLVRVRAEDILGKPLTAEQQRELDELATRPIDYSDIPPLTDEQLARAIPFRLRPKTTMVSLRLPDDVLAWLKSKGPGHLSRINAILTNVMEAEKRLQSR